MITLTARTFLAYRKVASSRLSWLVAHSRIFRLFIKGKFDPYVLWPLAKRVQNWIVDRFTARDFTVWVKNFQNLKVKCFSILVQKLKHFIFSNKIQFFGVIFSTKISTHSLGKFITLHKARALYLEGRGRHKNFTQI